MARAAVVMAAGAACVTGCQFDPSGLAPGPGDPVDAAMPPVDAAGDGGAADIDASPVDAQPVICEADTLTCLEPDLLGQCLSDGTGYDEQTCPAGCVDAPDPHCAKVVPSNGISSDLPDMSTGALDTTGNGTLVFDTDTGGITAGDGSELRPAVTGLDEGSGIFFEVVAQSGNRDIGVFAMTELQVAAGTEIRGKGDNAMAIVASGDITISGVIDVTGGTAACRLPLAFDDAAQCPGPGALAGGPSETAATGPGGGQAGAGSSGAGVGESGGGGGGHGAAGGTGGDAQNRAGGAAGQAFADEALTPLTGGGGGGGGGDEGDPAVFGGAGGGGGGALQLVSGTAIELQSGESSPCGINAGGGGAGIAGGSGGGGGGGGGAGGGILLEAPAVELASDCVLAANGGGGSGAGDSAPGETGLLSDQAAAGSDGQGRDRGPGGAGGALETPTGADAEDRPDDDAGGGGGGAGAIRINILDDGFETEGITSPAPTTGAVTVE